MYRTVSFKLHNDFKEARVKYGKHSLNIELSLQQILVTIIVNKFKIMKHLF